MWIIPIVAMLIVGRQAYLSSYYGLSAWKGGGMGMFASADSSTTRFARLYLKSPDAPPQPLTRITPEQQRLIERALWYPVRKNFVAAANSIRLTQWATGGQVMPVHAVDRRGSVTGKTKLSYEMLMPFGKRASAQETHFSVIIEYYSLGYDVKERTIRAEMRNSFRFDTIE